MWRSADNLWEPVPSFYPVDQLRRVQGQPGGVKKPCLRKQTNKNPTNAGQQAWLQTPFHTEPSHCPFDITCVFVLRRSQGDQASGSAFRFPSAGIIGIYHHAQVMWGWGSNPGLPECWVSTPPTEPHHAHMFFSLSSHPILCYDHTGNQTPSP